jgi:hypothetical protein
LIRLVELYVDTAPGLVLAFASEIGPGFSLGIQPLYRIGGFNPREHAFALLTPVP